MTELNKKELDILRFAMDYMIADFKGEDISRSLRYDIDPWILSPGEDLNYGELKITEKEIHKLKLKLDVMKLD